MGANSSRRVLGNHQQAQQANQNNLKKTKNRNKMTEKRTVSPLTVKDHEFLLHHVKALL